MGHEKNVNSSAPTSMVEPKEQWSQRRRWGKRIESMRYACDKGGQSWVCLQRTFFWIEVFRLGRRSSSSHCSAFVQIFYGIVLGGSKCIQAIPPPDLIVVTHHFRDQLGVLLRMLLTKRPWLRPWYCFLSCEAGIKAAMLQTPVFHWHAFWRLNASRFCESLCTSFTDIQKSKCNKSEIAFI